MSLPDIQFNELSCHPVSSDGQGARMRVKALIETFKGIAKEGVRNIRCSVPIDQICLMTDGATLNSYCNDRANRLHANYLRAYLKYPFIDDTTPQANKYAQWSFCIVVDGQRKAPAGLSAAYLQGVPSIGFLSCDFWRKHLHTISITKDAIVETATVICLSSPDHCQTQEVAEWIASHTPERPLQTCAILPGDKRVHLRDDHGKDKLLALARRLTHSRYVIEVINSLPFNNSARCYIERCHPDGKIEIRIPITQDDRGLGLIVLTTGRTERETERIADILETEL